MHILKIMLSVSFTTLIAIGWPVIALANRNNILSSEILFIAALILSGVILIREIHNAIPKGISKERSLLMGSIVNQYLLSLLDSYYVYVSQKNNSQPLVRANVMLITRGFFGNYLNIYFHASPDSISYSQNELSTIWKKNEGAVGWVWKHIKKTSCDPKIPPQDSKTLNNKQKDISGNIGSILAMPIIYDKKFIGILSLDSSEDINVSYFNDEELLRIITEYSNGLSPILPIEGVSS